MEIQAVQHQVTNILESLTDGFVGLDSHWRYTYVNAAAEQVIGKPRQDLLGRIVWEAFPEAVGKPLYLAVQRAMTERTPVTAEAVSPVTGGLTEVRAYPSEDGLVVYFRDITKRKEAEIARDHLAALVESSDDAIIGKTLDGIVTSWNPAAERLYGYPADEIVGQSIAVLVPPNRPDELPSILERLSRGERTVNYETLRIRKDGQPVDVALSISPIRDPTGQILGAATIARDISSRKREEAIIRRHAALLNLAPVAILARDLEGKITFWNRAAMLTYGVTAEEAIGQVSHRLLRTEFPAPLDAIEASLMRDGYWEGELRHRRIDGEGVIALSRWAVELDLNGRPIGILEINRNITARNRAEFERQSLLLQERAARREADTAHHRSALVARISERLAETLDPEVVVAGLARLVVPDLADWCVVELLDRDGTVRLVDAAHHDRTKEPLIHDLRRRYPPDRSRRYGLSEVLRTGRPQLCPVVEEEWRREAARDVEHLRLMESLNCQSSICVPLVARGHILGALTLAASDSARRYGASELRLAEDLAHRCALALDHARLHQRLERTLHLREVFLASTAHDLRSPLNVIQGFTHLLNRKGDKTPDPQALGAAVETIARSATQLGELVDQLQDIAMVEAGQPMPLHRAATDLLELARDAAATHADATKREIHVVTEITTLVGQWDRSRLKRVFDNLVSNAVKYSPGERQVVLTISEECGSAVLRVRDEGMGIPADDLSRLFERFHRGRNVGNRIPGTGVGLWGVRCIVEEHGGTIHIDSRENAGTTVTVLLPLA